MIIPVFDVKDGMFVSGQSGKRDTYTPLDSVYGDTTFDIIHNLKSSGAHVVYIADLDKIEGVGDNSSLIREINDIIPVLLDNGASSYTDIVDNRDICSYSIIATETMSNIDDFLEVFERGSFDDIVVSVDIKDDNLLVANGDILLDDVLDLINKVKPAYTIVLNISQVGTAKGNISDFVFDVIRRTPYTQHIIGGGVTNSSICEYNSIGIDNFLIGTLLHRGELLREYLVNL